MLEVGNLALHRVLRAARVCRVVWVQALDQGKRARGPDSTIIRRSSRSVGMMLEVEARVP